jgi:hypothetical protein
MLNLTGMVKAPDAPQTGTASRATVIANLMSENAALHEQVAYLKGVMRNAVDTSLSLLPFDDYCKEWQREIEIMQEAAK